MNLVRQPVLDDLIMGAACPPPIRPARETIGLWSGADTEADTELRHQGLRRPRRSGGTWVRAGMGGQGKSTVAVAAAGMARARGWCVWWVTATHTALLTGGMQTVAVSVRRSRARHQAGARGRCRRGRTSLVIS